MVPRCHVAPAGRRASCPLASVARIATPPRPHHRRLGQEYPRGTVIRVTHPSGTGVCTATPTRGPFRCTDPSFPPPIPPSFPPAAVDYPNSDGKPLAENDAQLHAILYAVGALRVRYGDRPDVYVSGDLLVYYEEGNPRVSIAPDAFVVFGVEDRKRMSYKVWEEGKGPDFVLEVASPNTWREDVETKPGIYANLGVSEYFLFDPNSPMSRSGRRRFQNGCSSYAQLEWEPGRVLVILPWISRWFLQGGRAAAQWCEMSQTKRRLGRGRVTASTSPCPAVQADVRYCMPYPMSNMLQPCSDP